MRDVTFEELEKAREQLEPLVSKLNPHESLLVTSSGIVVVESKMFAPDKNRIEVLEDESLA